MPVLGLILRASAATPLPPLNPSDPLVKAPGFVNEAGRVDAAANPTYKADQRCANCAQ